MGFDAIHTTSFIDGHLLSDYDILKVAIQEKRIIISKDSDFWDYFLLKGPPPQILMVQFGNISNVELIHLFESNMSAIELLFENGSGLVLFDRLQVSGF